MPGDRPATPAALRRLAEILAIALITAAAMHLGQSEKLGLLRQSGLSPLWPATGVNIGLIFLFGPRIWPGIFLGSLADNILVFGGTRPSVPIFAPIADTLEPLLAIWLYRLSRGRPQPLSRTADALRFGLICALLAPATCAALGVAMLWHSPGLFNGQPALQACVNWGLPAAVGVLVVTPAIICWRGLARLPWSNTGRLHAVGILSSLVALEYWVFSDPTTLSGFEPHLLIFLVLPLIVWANLVFGARGGAVTTLAASIVAVFGVVRGLGPFSDLPLVKGLLILQVYLAAFSAVSILLGAVTEERAAAYRATIRQTETIKLLFEELNHRVRNNLASLLSLIDLSRSASSDVERFATLIAGRVQAMAEIHSVLASGRWVSMSVGEMLRSIAPHDVARRIDCAGPDVNVPPQQATPLGLVFHELVVNSLKYGALGSSDGRVNLEWQQVPDPPGTRLFFTWRELPSSRVSPPPRNSDEFNGHAHGPGPQRSGLDLIEGLIRADLCGTVTFSFPPDGAVHTFEVRIDPALRPV
ncbi:MAG: MASE1 domain-containing protein [Phycisphaerales bacterium]